MTLAELLVFTFLMSILATAVLAVYVLSMRYMRIAQAALDLQASAQKSVASLVADLADTNATTIKVTSTPPSIIFASPRDGNGQIEAGPIWQAWIGYYIDANNNLIRKRVPMTPSATLPSNPYTLASFQADSGSTVLVAANDTALSCTGTQPVVISGTFTVSVQSPSDCQITLKDSVWPRN
jgi:hypothetical protein